jgi:hypothetical protein
MSQVSDISMLQTRCDRRPKRARGAGIGRALCVPGLCDIEVVLPCQRFRQERDKVPRRVQRSRQPSRRNGRRKPDCDTFQGFGLHENLYLLTSHIYTFQHKGFEAKHQISIKGLLEALERNRKLLEDLYPKLSSQKKDIYSQFYDEKRRFKCTRITCRYFSEGFADASQKKKHINMHNRPFHCDVTNCLGNEGFTNNNDLLK